MSRERVVFYDDYMGGGLLVFIVVTAVKCSGELGFYFPDTIKQDLRSAKLTTEILYLGICIKLMANGAKGGLSDNEELNKLMMKLYIQFDFIDVCFISKQD